MNTVIQRQIVVTADWQPLSAERLVGTFDISCPSTNAGNVIFQANDASEIPWIPGESHQLFHVNLAEIRIRGVAGDIVTAVGGVW